MTLNRSATILLDVLAAGHPEWRALAKPYGPDDDREAEPGSVRLSLPMPGEPAHQIEVLQRGNTIEVAYHCGPACGAAERQFVFGDGDIELVAGHVRDFLDAIFTRQTVIVRKRLGPITRWLRRDRIVELASFQP